MKPICKVRLLGPVRNPNAIRCKAPEVVDVSLSAAGNMVLRMDNGQSLIIAGNNPGDLAAFLLTVFTVLHAGPAKCDHDIASPRTTIVMLPTPEGGLACRICGKGPDGLKPGRFQIGIDEAPSSRRRRKPKGLV